MPRGDKRGPLGLGLGTGKGRVLCTSQNQRDSTPLGDSGFGQGKGLGARTSCRGISQSDQVEILKERVRFLKEYIENLRKRKS